MTETLKLLATYTRWADARLLDALAQVSPEPWLRDLGSSHRSLRDTVVHLASGQWMWLSRWKGVSPKAMWDPEEYPTVEPLRARWEEVSREMEAFIAPLTADSLERVVRYTNVHGKPLAFPLAPLILHLVNHSTYHRGQVATLLRQLGRVPVATDLFVYLSESAASQAAADPRSAAT